MELNEAIAHERKEAENYTITSNALYKDYYKVSLNCQKCADYHEQLAEWLTELQERREADRWIPVSERLPNTLGVYNVTRKIIEGETSYVISDACYFDGQNTWHADTGVNHGRPYLTDVIAWQPLPKPYKESEDK